MEKQKQQPQRLQSLDALRGFDMLFIMGGASLFVALATLFPNPFFQAIAGQMEHVEWNGLAHHDTIFPLFLFIAGISFPFSLEKQRGKGMTEGAIYKKIVRRGITLVFLGLVYNGLLSFEFDHLRCASVLARIGLGWMFAALLFVRFGWKVRAGITVLILVGYWLAMAFVPVPDAGGAGPFTLEGNLVGYIDRLFLPGRLHETVFDPEGLFSTVPAIATAMLGMFTGEWIKLRKEGLTDRKKVLCLVGAGASSSPPSPPEPEPLPPPLPEPPPSPLPPEAGAFLETSSKTMLLSPPRVVAVLSLASRRALSTLKRRLTRVIFLTVQSFSSSTPGQVSVV